MMGISAVTSGSNMSKDEIDQAIRDAENYANADKEKKEAVENFNSAQSVAISIEQNLKDLDGKISPDDKNRLETMIQEIKSITDHQNVAEVTKEIGDELKQKTEALTNEAQNVFAKVYNPNSGYQTNTEYQETQNNDQTQNDDDVIDGEFKEV